MGATKHKKQARLDTYDNQKAGNKSHSLRTALSLNIIQRHKKNYNKCSEKTEHPCCNAKDVQMPHQ